MNQTNYPFRVGHIVHLKSGSPDLKIVALADDKAAVCWNAEDKLELAVFPYACLRLHGQNLQEPL